MVSFIVVSLYLTMSRQFMFVVVRWLDNLLSSLTQTGPLKRKLNSAVINWNQQTGKAILHGACWRLLAEYYSILSTFLTDLLFQST